MISEKDFEDIICKYPELIEDGLNLKGRQLTIYGRRMDILFEDKFKRKLIVELKVGPIKDEHIGQILSYEGMLLSADDPTIRVMLIGSRVPPNIQKSLDHHGIAWKEITISKLKEFLNDKRDNDFIKLFQEVKPTLIKEKTKTFSHEAKVKKESSGVWIFQTNPKWYRFIEKLKFGSNKETWRVMHFKDEIKKGDTLLFWMAGENAGIYAMGEVTSNPEFMVCDEETKEFCTPEYGKNFPIVDQACTRVWCRYNKKFIDNPVLKEDLKNNELLKELSIIKQPQGTNFRVTKGQWEELKRLIP